MGAWHLLRATEFCKRYKWESLLNRGTSPLLLGKRSAYKHLVLRKIACRVLVDTAWALGPGSDLCMPRLHSCLLQTTAWACTMSLYPYGI